MSGALVLVGLSGSGKSTVGRLVAGRLGLVVRDTDRLIEQLASETVAALFSGRGEAAFRDLEEKVVAEVCRLPCVAAMGGGAVLRPANRARMRSGNLVIWLDTPVSILTSRLARHVQGEERPLLRGNLDDRMAALWVERRSAYAAASHVRIPTVQAGHSGTHAVAVVVTESFKAWLNGRPTWKGTVQ